MKIKASSTKQSMNDDGTYNEGYFALKMVAFVPFISHWVSAASDIQFIVTQLHKFPLYLGKLNKRD